MKLSLEGRTVLITGAAGFIGANLAERLLKDRAGVRVIGIDNMNPYYDVSLKEMRLSRLEKFENFCLIRGSIADPETVGKVFETYAPSVVVNLAAQTGVRYSLTNPDVYIESNLIGFFRILEACRHSLDGGKKGVEHFVYASSSSVYGCNEKVPYSVQDKADSPVSLYAATKKSDEMMAYAYSSLFQIPTTGLRFFTVYGPAGRPDMAYFRFTDKLVRGETIEIFNNGDMYRDFTYIDDTVAGITKVLQAPPSPDAGGTPHKLYNIGNCRPENLLTFVETLERCLMEQGVIDRPGKKTFLPMQAGDVYQTCADMEETERDFGFRPHTGLYEGLSEFVKWYRGYRGKETTP
ncbi:MAG: NAD-dependent epimerase/dehydratase family protein [Lachnospiraceae bacterium]|nr:NAD-dependent epimerase/dehydratase family protein [Lachnospiraceae bacterium]